MSAESAGIKIESVKKLIEGVVPVSTDIIVESTITCAGPKINSFTPIEAKVSLQAPKIIILGSGLWGNTKVSIGGYPCVIESGDTDDRLVIIPQTKNSGKITITTDYGTTTSDQSFTFKP